jgi:hypothetical protein
LPWMSELKQAEDLHRYYRAMINGGYDGDDKDVWDTLHAGFRETKERIAKLKINGGNGKAKAESNGGNGKAKAESNGGNGKNNPDHTDDINKGPVENFRN